MTVTVEPTTRVLLARVVRVGRPRTKGSLKVFCMKNRTHSVRIEEETKDSSLWRRRVAKSAQVSMLEEHGGLVNYPGPVRVDLIFTFERQMAVRDGIIQAYPIPTHEGPYPTDVHLGDIDKLTRNVLDALVDAHVILDDSLVIAVSATKRWAAELEGPGVVGEVWTV